MKWSPLQADLGGSEQAVKYLSEAWAALGAAVTVYGDLSWLGTNAGVTYRSYQSFNPRAVYQTVIFWRLNGARELLPLKLKADRVLVDFHDNDDPLAKLSIQHADYLMVKSQFHKDLIESKHRRLSNCIVIPNGIRIEAFTKPISDPRDPFRFCYCNSYDRGLQRILESIWPKIHQAEPRAQLHIYYGMPDYMNPDLKRIILQLLPQAGVYEHGRKPVADINREKHLSTFHLYYTDSLAEIDCISIRESLVAGCIPILSNANLFKYRDGYHIAWTRDDQKVADSIIGLMRDSVQQTKLRIAGYRSKTIVSWADCAKRWMPYLVKN